MVELVDIKVINRVPELTVSVHRVKGYEKVIKAEFFGDASSPLMRPVLLIPEDSETPPHLRNPHNFPFWMPKGAEIEAIEIVAGTFKGCLMIVAKFHYRIGNELNHFDHILVD